MVMRKALLVLLCLLLTFPVSAANDPQQVFLIPGGRLTFVDLLTGDTQSLVVNGDHFTAMRNWVMFYDQTNRRVMLARPDGTLIEHPFVQPSSSAKRIDWHISHDEQTIAWTETSGDPAALTTVTWVASIDGTNKRQVFADGPRDGIRAYPVALNTDKSVLYMDYQPDTLGDLTAFRQYAGLFALDLVSGQSNSLPGEPGCFCGAGIGADMFLRLTLADGGFRLRILNLRTGDAVLLPPVTGYTQGGDVLIAPDGARAVYALAQISGIGTDNATVQTVIMLVDLVNLTQRPLSTPSSRILRPLAWTEDDSAVLLADLAAGTTWKATVQDGAFEQVANGVYIGTLVGG
jgi:hypothetical protein